jgi:hypothetical protein
VRGRGGCLGLGVWLGSLCESQAARPSFCGTARSHLSVLGVEGELKKGVTSLEGGEGIALQAVESRS